MPNQKQKFNNSFMGCLGYSMVYFCIVFFAFNIPPASADKCKVACDEKCTDVNGIINQDCKDQCKADEQKCETLSKQASVYENILKINNKTQDTLSSQLDNINQQQSQTTQVIKTVQQNLDELSSQIDSLKATITEKEKAIEYQKRILSNLMQTYYDYDRQGVLELVLWNKDMSVSFGQGDYIEQSGLKVSDVLEEIKTAQTQLVESNQKIQEDYQKNSNLSDQLSQTKEDLQATENQKQYLLQKTQGEEQKYQQMLAQIKEQKKQLFNFSAASNINDVLSSVNNYDKPDESNWLSSNWYYSQRDSRWANKKIGSSRDPDDTMGNIGCAISSVAMMNTYYGHRTSPSDILKNLNNFTGVEIKWPVTLYNYNKIKDTGYRKGLNYKSILDNVLDNDGVAIIHIHVSNGGHFLVVGSEDKKDYIVNDPYFGANLYLNTSLSLMGKLGGGGAYVDRVIYK